MAEKRSHAPFRRGDGRQARTRRCTSRIAEAGNWHRTGRSRMSCRRMRDERRIINPHDGKGRTPLALAVRACVDSYWTDRRTPEVVEALLRAGASVKDIHYPSGYAEADELLRQFGR